ncbi:MAG: HAMP domain-containing protein [Spirochaetales bacterium]|nr:HAMP domain-containing protein [Spirochaetales bacterium]
MKIARKLNISVLISILIFAVVIFLLTLFMFNTVMKNEISVIEKQNTNFMESKSNFYTKAAHAHIQQIATQALGLASLFSEDPKVIEAYKTALSGNIDDPESQQSQEARDALRSYFTPIISGYLQNTGQKLLKLHFHLPNGRSLVRLWRKGYQTKINGEKVDISDDISSFRKTVMEVNTPPYSPITGIEIGRGGFAIRGIAPVQTVSGKHLGSVEVLFPFSEVIQNKEEQGKIYYAVYMDIDKLPIAKSLQDAEKYPITDKAYVLTDYTYKKVTDKLVTRSILDKGHNGLIRVEKGYYFLTAFPIQDYSGKAVGTFVFAFDISPQKSALTSFKNGIKKTKVMSTIIFFGITAILAVISILLSLFVVKFITKSITRLNESMKDISEGQGDLTKVIEIKSSDEVGNLADSFNTFIHKLRTIIIRIRDTMETTISVKESLSAAGEETAASITQIAANINNIKTLIDTLGENIESTESNAESIRQNIINLDSIIEEQATAMEQSGAAVNQMVASINNVAAVTSEKQAATERLVGHTEKGEKIINTTIQAIRDVNNNIDSISEMVKVINAVAAQTNLLAMNAAIEAAHAGEAGKGFSVVADEIRKLAENVSVESKDITKELKTIIGKITTAVENGDETSMVFSEIHKEVSGVYDAFTEINTSASELTTGGRQLIDGIEKVTNITVKVKSASGEMTENMKNLSSAMQQVANIAAEVIGGINEINTGTKEIDKAMQQVTGLTVRLSDSSAELEKEVKRFII